MTYEEAIALSPTRAQILADGSRPSSQSGLADLLRIIDPHVLRDMLAEIADAHAFSWDADAMLRRVGQHIVLTAAAKL